ncbi:hypothetical protein RSK20926_13259 [Roseobacter sp. SK209-2-6]|uniref:GFA family protein n=1 Tax=Roseobacter sp. SK209-2-6 TaxID=388739 RepID=UPI0000F3C711|nr:hypothetical protein RSK20926_13259 [Roseobacter sp. SK209-2-6]
MPDISFRTWEGACHCRQIKFEIDAAIDHARICNCSICKMRGALNFRVPQQAFRLLTPWDRLSAYRWGTGSARDYFCQICGISPFRRPREATEEERALTGFQPFSGWAVNLRCIAGLDLINLPKQAIDGNCLPLPGQLP